MGEFLEYFREKKNFANLLILGIMILALPLGINLVRQQQIIKSRADITPIVIKGDNVVTKNGQLVATAPQVTLELISPLGSPARVAGTQIVDSRNFGIGSIKGLVKNAYATDCEDGGGVGEIVPCDANLQINGADSIACSVDQNGQSCTGRQYTHWCYTDGDGQNFCNYQESCSDLSCTTPPVDDSWCTEKVVEGKKVTACTQEDTLTGQGSCLKNGQTCTQYYQHECTTSTGTGYCSQPAGKCAEPCQGGSSPSPTPSTKPGACVVTNWSFNPQTPQPGGSVQVTATGNKEGSWQYVRYRLDSGPWLKDGLGVQVGPPPVFSFKFDSVSAGTHSVTMAQDSGNSVCAGPGQFSTAGVQAGVCDLGTDTFGMTDGCAACVLTGSGNPNLVKNIKELGAESGNKWEACGNTQLIGKWCASINKPACDTIKATPECVPVCGGTQTACPADIASTQARVRITERGTWTISSSINLGDNVFVAGFHNQQIDKVADDIVLTSTGPEGSDSHVQTLVTEANIATYKPSQAGKYTITATTKGKTGQNCTGSAILTVAVPAVTTTHFRIAEVAADLSGTPWEAYTDEPMTKAYEFKDKTPGEKTVFVEFKDSKGKEGGCGLNNSKPCSSKIRLLGSDPAITGCSLNFEGINTIFDITGANFGSTRGTVKSGETPLQIRDWKDSKVSVMWSNAPSGQVIPVSLTNSDGQSGEGQCGVTSQLSLGAKVFCRQPANQDIDNVDLTLVGAFEGGTKVRQKVKIDKDGLIQSLNQKLEAGKQYILSIKAPRSVRKTSDPFTAGGGITSLTNFVLPVGDIFPMDEGDGAINALDKGELNRQWIISSNADSRSGDFNRDNRVNSLDWACMRHGFGKSDDPEPVPGAVVSSPGPVSSPSPLSSPSPSPSPGL